MGEFILQTSGLTKEYHGVKALDNVNINISTGRLYGFIGQNGAGKTTMFRIITGLSYQTSGDISLFGVSTEKELVAARKRTGSLIETPALYPNMTAYQNLEIQTISLGIPEKDVINKTLELVGLSDTGKKQAKDFSLGMKQRLAIAVALLNEPEFLILDEPVNGLDPIGIVEIRELLKRLNFERGITMFISSHLLSELYQLATDYIFIDRGKIVEIMTLDKLNEKCKKHISVKVNDTAIAATVLESKLNTRDYQIMPDGTIKLYAFLDTTETVSKALSENGLIISKIAVEGDSLENYYISLIGGSLK